MNKELDIKPQGNANNLTQNVRARTKLNRKVQGNKDNLRRKKFNSACFIQDDQQRYQPGVRYEGVIGEPKHYTAHTKTGRHRITVSTRGLHKGDPVKSLVIRLPGKDGRNNNGHITSGHTHTAYRRMYRKIDFFRLSEGWAIIIRIERDPNRTGFIALIRDSNNRVSYIPATLNMRIGDKIYVGSNVDCVEGNVLPLANIENETHICNIELTPQSGTKMVRSAGTYATVVNKQAGYVLVRLPSGEERKFSPQCKAYVGHVSNQKHNRIRIGSAGKAHHKGRRPRPRAYAMNPVDHCLGGRSAGKVKTNFQGNMVHGHRTRSPRKNSRMIVTSRHRTK
jgi:large subunit ribosomal protein L2